jgi:hypothetical protein
MKTETYKRNDGSEGTNYTPEVGDKFKARYSSVRTVKTGIYENHSLGVLTEDGKEIYLKITKGQKTSLEKAGDLTGRTIEFYAYSNEYGDQVGAKAI